MSRESRIFVIVLAVVAVAAIVVSIVAAVQGPSFGVGPDGYYYPRYSGIWFGAMALWMLLFWALVIGGIVWLFSNLRPRETARVPEDPLDILRRRYASGEITKDQYEEMRRDLQQR